MRCSCAPRPRPAPAFALSSLAERLAERDSPPLRSYAGFVHAWFVRHWLEPIHDDAARILARAEPASTHGDVTLAASTSAAHVALLAASGAALDDVIAAGHQGGRAGRRAA